MFFRDTGHRSFWSKPELAALLLPRSPGPARAPVAPPSARELASASSTAVSRLTGEPGVVGDRARAMAADVAGAIAGLDGQITSLEGAVDAAEADRLMARLSALGSPTESEGEERRKMRDLFQKQLDLLRSLGIRIDGLKALRSGKLQVLRFLWLRAVELRASTNDEGRMSHSADRMRELCAELAQQPGGSLRTPGLTAEAAEAISDAPTIERK